MKYLFLLIGFILGVIITIKFTQNNIMHYVIDSELKYDASEKNASLDNSRIIFGRNTISIHLHNNHDKNITLIKETLDNLGFETEMHAMNSETMVIRIKKLNPIHPIAIFL